MSALEGRNVCRQIRLVSAVFLSIILVSEAQYTDLQLPFWLLETSGVETTLHDISFLEANIAFVVGERDTILYTENDGISWTSKATGSDQSGRLHWHGISFGERCIANPNWRPGFFPYVCDLKHGYAVGSIGNIVKTEDRGESWNIQSNFDLTERPDLVLTIGNTNLWKVQAVTSELAWIVGDNAVILHTSDGGVVWRVQTSPVTGSGKAIYNLLFESNSTGWVVGDQGLLLKTTNGGETWNKLPLAGYSGRQNFFSIRAYKDAADDVLFITAEEGLILRVASHLPGSGANATAVQTVVNATCGSDAINGVVFHQAAQSKWPHEPVIESGFAVGQNGVICQSSDRGYTWEHQVDPPLPLFCKPVRISVRVF
ncbi:hypothetical protein CYMTET_36244 [Cymbomonas tetramitiformis]|uniref:Photosynthesis system II assembly factor Ycf48/Hcf136-like domain-containing protein n=1 Tax=Cymbomonas tetramitiformis TaxID=36881 RepID=A0AAE0F7E3_9CHLO|nr:hypothetical protein CYMTET_36244 [Cymbomonas tetramitiformis]